MSMATLINRSLLTRHLDRLVDELTRVRDGKIPSGRTDPPPLRWEDDDYIYLEVNLSDCSDLDADISVWAGRAVIRLGR
jgi:hypothetical protein